MDKFVDMDLFVRVVQSGGLASAGREVGLSPASVTTRINGLEKRYGTRLLNRTTRRVSVTEAGKTYYDASICILADIAEVESQLVEHRNELAGPLRITAPSDLGQQHVAPLLAKLVKKHEGITPHLHVSDDVVNLIELNVDLAIRYGEPPDSTLIAKRLSSNHRVLCASKAYLKKKGTPKKPEDLKKHNCLSMVRQMEPLNTWYFTQGKEEHVVSINPSSSSNDGALVRQWAIDGLGIALKSILDVAEDLKQGRLTTVLDSYAADIRSAGSNHISDLYVTYPSRQFVPERVRTFIGMLERHFESLSSAA